MPLEIRLSSVSRRPCFASCLGLALLWAAATTAAWAQAGTTGTPTEESQAAEHSQPPLGATSGGQAPSAQVEPNKAPKTVAKPVVTISRPHWNELTRRQQEALEPLSSRWDQLSEAHKRKWIALSHNYRSLSDDEKEKLHSRMTEWVTLTVQERVQARLNYAQTNQLAPDNKKAQWEAYQALSDEERQKLVSQAPAHPVGAATPVKPVPPQKLTQLPPPKTDTRQSGKIQTGPHHVDMHTLLPQATVAARSTATAATPSSKP
ncbi:DUF3106 domain-containing protein [Curvibacter sp. RS43]|uniref:DUF3106 domain-containing protein n=1 Tax=Curvibacter microcysteis TaxID=3026419 RepID=UPI00235F85D4|nr:DUF3106 domain-containing protein [Curvibacter sp. RS43]MDD0809368.1 DUF3106 domain-containing protein [Curvibacter sp. RS43]